ncbi:hypothetical protein JVU11DRAFT_11826 [Chiua virens]|nr:hypothetical protein JVU11DRAFT_11826 [Chiua virens]
MGTIDIPLDKAELLSVLLEALLYGFSLLMFGGTMWILLSQRSTERLNHKMLAVACAFLLFSTVHFVIDIVRIMEGLILYRDSYPRGPDGYFSDVSHWTFVSKNYLYAAQTLIGDGVILYRCYAVWQSKLVMILPVLLWFAVIITGMACPYTEFIVAQDKVFGGVLSRWITAFYASTFTTNLLTTLLLAYRIWSIDRKATSMRDPGKSPLRPILYIIMDAGLIYSVSLFAALICFANQSNGQYVILDTLTPIISITFYMVIIRVGLANRAHQSQIQLISTGRRSGQRAVHVTTSTEYHIDNGQSSMITSPISPITPTSIDNEIHRGDPISDKTDRIRETV